MVLAPSLGGTSVQGLGSQPGVRSEPSSEVSEEARPHAGLLPKAFGPLGPAVDTGHDA